MCCRSSVEPLDVDLAVTLLQVGQFKPSAEPLEEGQPSRYWQRYIPEEDVTINVSLAYDSLEVSMTPTISHYDHHAMRRIAGGVYFEIMAKYAEKVGGKVTQKANVTGCAEGGVNSLLLAQYPSIPLTFDRVCNGFQEALMEHEH